MTSVFLFLYAVVLGTLGARLSKATWPERAPRLGIVAWQAVSASVVTAFVLAGLSLAVPAEAMGGHLTHFVQACVHLLRGTDVGLAQKVLTRIAMVSALGAVVRVAWCLLTEIVRASQARRRHAGVLAIVGTYRADLGITVVNDASAVIYCLPGRSPRVVMTSGALAALDGEQVRAALAHERAHIAGRHDLVIAGASALKRAIPAVPLFRIAHHEVCRLIEMLADDAAGRHHDRSSVAAAISHLAGVPRPKVGLAAGGPTAAARVRRLTMPARPLGLLRTLMGAAVVALVLLIPVALLVGPGGRAIEWAYCELPMDQSTGLLT